MLRLSVVQQEGTRSQIGGRDLERSGLFTPYTSLFNVTGQPAISLPLSTSPDGLPIGVQLVGPPLGDALLLRVASQLEAARPWVDRRPPHS